MDASQLKELKELQEENRRLKQMYADLSLDKVMLKKRTIKKVVSPAVKKQVCEHLIATYEIQLFNEKFTEKSLT